MKIFFCFIADVKILSPELFLLCGVDPQQCQGGGVRRGPQGAPHGGHLHRQLHCNPGDLQADRRTVHRHVSTQGKRWKFWQKFCNKITTMFYRLFCTGTLHRDKYGWPGVNRIFFRFFWFFLVELGIISIGKLHMKREKFEKSLKNFFLDFSKKFFPNFARIFFFFFLNFLFCFPKENENF